MMKNSPRATVNTLTMKGCVTMPLPQQNKEYTIDAIYALPDGQQAELIDGQIYYQDAPDSRHRQILLSLSQIIARYSDYKSDYETCKAPFFIYLNAAGIAPFAVSFGADNKTYIRPDISVISANNGLTGGIYRGVLDWIIEIVSPGSRQMDYFAKLFKYHDAGVREYWIVDPEKDRVTVYNFEKENVAEYTFYDSIESGIYKDLTIDFSLLKI